MAMLARWFAPGRVRKYLARSAMAALWLTLFLGFWYLVPIVPKSTFRTGEPQHLHALAPDGKTLVTVEDAEGWILGGPIDVWNVASGQKRLTLVGPLTTCYYAAYSPDGRYFVTNQSGISVRLWDIASGALLADLHEPRSANVDLRFSTDSRYLIIGRSNNGADEQNKLVAEPSGFQPLEPATITFWEIATKQPRATFNGSFEGMTFTPDGRTMALVQRERDSKRVRLQLWEMEAGPGAATLRLERLVSAKHLFCSPDFGCYATTDGDLSVAGPFDVNLWETTTGEQQVHFFDSRSTDAFLELRFISARKMIIEYFDDSQTVVNPFHGPPMSSICDVKNRQVQLRVSGWGALVTHDERWVVRPNASGAEVYELATGSLHHSLAKPGDVANRHSRSVMRFRGQTNNAACLLAQDGRTALVTGLDNNAPPSPLAAFLGRFIPAIRTGPRENVARLWVVETGQELASFEDCYQGLYSPDGKTLATAHTDGRVRLWDVPPRKPFLAILGTSLVGLMAFLVGVRLWMRLVRWRLAR